MRFILPVLLAALGSAGHAQTFSCFNDPLSLEANSFPYLGNPQKAETVIKQADVLHTSPFEVRRVLETLKNSQIQQRITYTKDFKLTETFIYNDKQAVQGLNRLTLDDQSNQNVINIKALDLNDAQTLKKSAGDKVTFTYDDQGRLLEFVGFADYNDFLERARLTKSCKYIDTSKVTESVKFTLGGSQEVLTRKDATLDSQGRITSAVFFTQEGPSSKTLRQSLKEEYAYRGNMLSTYKRFYPNKALDSTTRLTYDHSGKMVRMVTEYRNGTVSTTLKYDAQGNWVERATYQGNQLYELITRVIQY